MLLIKVINLFLNNPVINFLKNIYECIALLSTDRAASFTASEKVGCAWHVLAISSELAPNSIAIPISAIHSPA